jgi:hypothetical protein
MMTKNDDEQAKSRRDEQGKMGSLVVAGTKNGNIIIVDTAAEEVSPRSTTTWWAQARKSRINRVSLLLEHQSQTLLLSPPHQTNKQRDRNDHERSTSKNYHKVESAVPSGGGGCTCSFPISTRTLLVEDKTPYCFKEKAVMRLLPPVKSPSATAPDFASSNHDAMLAGSDPSVPTRVSYHHHHHHHHNSQAHQSFEETRADSRPTTSPYDDTTKYRRDLLSDDHSIFNEELSKFRQDRLLQSKDKRKSRKSGNSRGFIHHANQEDRGDHASSCGF